VATHELGTRAPPVLPAAVEPVKISLHDCLACRYVDARPLPAVRRAALAG
jgi:hypothetical protein